MKSLRDLNIELFPTKWAAKHPRLLLFDHKNCALDAILAQEPYQDATRFTMEAEWFVGYWVVKRSSTRYPGFKPRWLRSDDTFGKCRSHRKRLLLLNELVGKQNGICPLCNRELDGVINLDHILPRSKGGWDGTDNLQAVHLICNSQKGNRLIGNIPAYRTGMQ